LMYSDVRVPAASVSGSVEMNQEARRIGST
jgi:hypothetical protein